MQPLRLVQVHPQGIHCYQCRLCGCIYADPRPVEALGCDCDTDDHDGDCLATLPRDHDDPDQHHGIEHEEHE